MQALSKKLHPNKLACNQHQVAIAGDGGRRFEVLAGNQRLLTIYERVRRVQEAIEKKFGGK